VVARQDVGTHTSKLWPMLTQLNLHECRRTSLAPEMARVQIDHEAWVVPQFSSTGGFEYGLFDVNNEITYFD